VLWHVYFSVSAKLPHQAFQPCLHLCNCPGASDFIEHNRLLLNLRLVAPLCTGRLSPHLGVQCATHRHGRAREPRHRRARAAHGKPEISGPGALALLWMFETRCGLNSGRSPRRESISTSISMVMSSLPALAVIRVIFRQASEVPQDCLNVTESP